MKLTSSINASVLLLVGTISALVLAQNELFKINKLNLIYTKARHSLGPTKLKDLKNDLSKHEFDELSLKKLKSHNKDKDGLIEAATRKKLLSIMAKYSLERYYDDVHPPIDDEHPMKQENLSKAKLRKNNQSNDEIKPIFRDKKLDKLWKKAEQSGFTQEQLMILHEEFQHQQDKLDDHYENINKLEIRLEGRLREEANLENSIETDVEAQSKKRVIREKVKESPSEKKARLESNIHQTLDEKHKDIKKNIKELHRKIVDGKVGGPFEEAPVNALWSSAIAANFTSKELESLKEELEHYETRIKKLKHFENELERDNLGAKQSVSDSLTIDKETKHLRKRIDELSHKVEKTHLSIQKKITERRDEL